jgi:hypothetical protein
MQNRSNTPAGSIPEWWRLNVYLDFIDHLITQLTDRLLKPLPRLSAQYLLPNFLPHLTIDMLVTIKKEYAPFLTNPDTFDTEIDTWKFGLENGNLPLYKNLQEALVGTEYLFPNLHTIFKVLLTMPVSTASVERSFSCLRRVKSYLRNTMGKERLTGLALLNIHRNFQVDVNKVIHDYDTTGDRKIMFLLDADEQK